MALAQKREELEHIPPDMKVNRGVEVVLFYPHELKKSIEKKRPNVILLDEGKNDNFKPMLDGIKDLNEYLRERKYLSPARGEVLKFLKEFHANNRDVIIELRSEFPNEYATDVRKARKDARERIVSCMEGYDFDGAVDATMKYTELNMKPHREGDELAMKEVAEKIKNGEWSGTIFIEASVMGSRKAQLLKNELSGMENVRITYTPLREEEAEKVFGKGVAEVFTPLSELERFYSRGKNSGGERDRLIAARHVAWMVISMGMGGSEREFISIKHEATKMANKLRSYEECRELFKELRPLDNKSAFNFVDLYIKKKDGIPIKRETTNIQEFTLGSHPLKVLGVSQDEEEDKVAVFFEAGPLRGSMNDRMQVSVSGVGEKKPGRRISDWAAMDYAHGSFGFVIAEIEIPLRISLKYPDLEFPAVPDQFIEKFKTAGVNVSDSGALTFDELKKVIALAKEGKLQLDERVLSMFEKFADYEQEMRQAASLSGEVGKLRKHPQVEEIFERRVDRFVDGMKKLGYIGGYVA